MPETTAPPAPLLLVDGFNLLWAGTFGFPAPIHSRDRTRELTGLFAFFALLRAAIRDDLDVAEPEVLVVFDGEHGSAGRAATDQDYKANREATAEALKPLQFLAPVKDGLDAHGIRWVEVDDAEADDVIATLATRAADSRPVLIMSRDMDYYQLLDARVRILNRSRKSSHRIITATEVLTRFGVTPDQWPAFRALTGDKSDNIPGMRGVGPKVAAALLRDGMRLRDLPESGRLTGAKGTAITTAWADVLRWEAMITVHRDLAVPVAATGLASPQLPKPADVVEKLGLW
ncbi:5'-3' exonuclease [Kitasatospora purpeofusca]|uniref:5'-3' exonuclease n=1 Tax=Kitasatospora purpeofusca TaxID=67352 RepID=A0ABZ1TVY9_9ACTN|nr:5'-3' exonuclease H3TH domain-containing protein [Kitasatospora purpeofusca]